MLLAFSNNFDKKNYEAQVYDFGKTDINEGFKTNSDVSYNILAFNFKDKGFKYNSKMAVLSSLLSKTYLHNEIRAKGGAYGCGVSINKNGNVSFMSYRDPNVSNTFDVYKKTGDYLKNLDLSKDDVEKIIIGSINSSFNPPLTPMSSGKIALSMYLTGVSNDELKDDFLNALETTNEDLKNFYKIFEDEKEYICTIGNPAKIEEDKKEFKVLKEI